MKNFITSVVLGFGITGFMASPAFAESEQSAEQESATVIFVRGRETSKTRSLNFNVYLSDTAVGRMKVKGRKEVTVPAGDYIVQTNFYNSESLPLTLEAGKTYTISTMMESKSNTSKARFEVINNDIAASNEAKLASKDDS